MKNALEDPVPLRKNKKHFFVKKILTNVEMQFIMFLKICKIAQTFLEIERRSWQKSKKRPENQQKQNYGRIYTKGRKNMKRNIEILWLSWILVAVVMLCASCQGSQPDLSATALQSRFDTLSDYERETSGLNYKVYRSTEKGNPFGTEEDRVADCWKPLAKSATVSEYESGYLHTGMSLDEVVQRMGRPLYSNIQSGAHADANLDLVYKVHFLYMTDKGNVLVAEFTQDYQVFEESTGIEGDTAFTYVYPTGLVLSGTELCTCRELTEQCSQNPVSGRISEELNFRSRVQLSHEDLEDYAGFSGYFLIEGRNSGIQEK